uniref:NAD(P)H-quinone oxidoreductase n=2 Tax=Anthoceros TaxID=3233 RepID=A0A6M8ATP1_ANTPU|nr:NADH dehydrogenase 30 kDa subunit [Anthoceros punctatus]YP_009863057.1 NADH dehydrogenase 30 kDa subunit [Anthoceros agrestis]QKD76423.1 NADH dehydrogenase 30 kDa subunit [Anthoceros punctatus]QKD76513.1 NADH dehydrogenase 30 kDa subunit [Anthoceros agrestis]
MLETFTNDTNEIQGRLSAWPIKHRLAHRPLGFDYQGVETLEVRSEDWLSIAVALYAYGSNYLRPQCVYDVALGGLLASVYHPTKVQSNADQPEEVCIKIFVSRKNPKIPFVFWVWKGADFQERESYDMLGISYESHPRLKRILMPDSWIGWPLRKDYIVPNFYELQDAY